MQKKIKIIHIIPNFKTGGAEKLVIDFLKLYNSENYEMSVVSMYPKEKGILYDIIDKDQLNVKYFHKKKGFDIQFMFNINRFLKKEKPDIIHTHNYVIKHLLITLFTNFSFKRIHTVHTLCDIELNRVDRIIQKIAYNFLNVRPIAISKCVYDSIQQFYKIHSTIIYNGIRINEKFDRKFTNNPNFTLLNVGRFVKEKNHKALLKAFSQLILEFPNLKLVLAGDGLLKEELKFYSKQLGIDKNLEFLGFVKNITKLMEQVDIYIVSSKVEGFNITILEAMERSLPVLSSDVGIAKEILDKNYIVTKENFENQLASKIKNLIKNKIQLEENAVYNRQKAINFNIKETFRNYEKLYGEL